jgi:hypothetical protein
MRFFSIHMIQADQLLLLFRFEWNYRRKRRSIRSIVSCSGLPFQVPVFRLVRRWLFSASQPKPAGASPPSMRSTRSSSPRASHTRLRREALTGTSTPALSSWSSA